MFKFLSYIFCETQSNQINAIIKKNQMKKAINKITNDLNDNDCYN